MSSEPIRSNHICPYSGRARAGWFKVETEYCRTRHPCKSDGTRPIEDPVLVGARSSRGGETGARMLLQIYASLAQLAEQRTVNPRVVGSIPARSANSAWTTDMFPALSRDIRNGAWVLGSPERSPPSPDVVIAERSIVPKAGNSE